MLEMAAGELECAFWGFSKGREDGVGKEMIWGVIEYGGRGKGWYGV